MKLSIRWVDANGSFQSQEWQAEAPYIAQIAYSFSMVSVHLRQSAPYSLTTSNIYCVKFGRLVRFSADILEGMIRFFGSSFGDDIV